MKEKKFMDLKVYENKRNKQGTVILPKKFIGEMPKVIRLHKDKIWNLRRVL